jgi:hypothetical protein
MKVYARPFEFSGNIVNHQKSLDAFGNLVRPTKVLLTCPACGAGIEYKMQGECICEQCERQRPKPVHPFVDPVRTNVVALSDLIDHAFNPSVGFNKPVDVDKRRAVFGDDFIDYGPGKKLPKSDLGINFDEDLVEE